MLSTRCLINRQRNRPALAFSSRDVPRRAVALDEAPRTARVPVVFRARLKAPSREGVAVVFRCPVQPGEGRAVDRRQVAASFFGQHGPKRARSARLSRRTNMATSSETIRAV